MNTKLISDAQGTYELSLAAVEASNRILWVREIDSDSAVSFIRKLSDLTRDNNDPIHIYINSLGGEVDAGLAMYDAIAGCEVPIITCAIGHAYSMGAILLTAGTQRRILPHSKVMIHEPLIREGASGSASALKTTVDSI